MNCSNETDLFIKAEDKNSFNGPLRNNISEKNNSPESPQIPYFYLLISIEQKVDKVFIIPELHGLSDSPQPLDGNDDGQRGLTCDLTYVSEDDRPAVIAEQLSKPLGRWIEEAESQLLNQFDNQIDKLVTLEIFLPWQLLDMNIHQWRVIDELEDVTGLSGHRGWLVRSLDRMTKPGLRIKLNSGWDSLEIARTNNRLNNHWGDIDCQCRNLEALLSAAYPIYRLPDGLPEDKETRQNLLKKLLKAPSPIALWTQLPQSDRQTTLDIFDTLLSCDNLIESARLAECIRQQRFGNSATPVELTVLYDCPHRFPTLPSPDKPLQGQS
ncbi:hypothetical protein E1H12_16710 [Geitlerinema sp. P-1104]|uniref:VMAP-C domain-containing protein n=1 Tax=Geitlerinema sp. P-1104 TaxID=2546230 RepID=UPI001476D300|nr:hypothetical protein [Geitlerinema sp. P-1104]NMG60111.1 hypothetical protein [Geitlerinema sp. P-1104]